MRAAARPRMRDGWLAAATLAGFALVALAARARPDHSGAAATGAPRSGVPVIRTTPPPPNEGPPRVPPRGRSLHLRLPWSVIEWLLIGILLLAVIGVLVALWPQLRARGRYGRAPRRSQPMEPAPDDLIRQVSSTLRATLSQVAEGQIRDGVILCWRRLEQTAEAAGLRRSPADTSSDLAGRLLASMPLSEAPLNRLAALYREARFSSHPIPAEAVAQARADLAQLRSELEAAAGLWSGHG
jgi:Domain of unknown function (DUF4129)